MILYMIFGHINWSFFRSHNQNLRILSLQIIQSHVIFAPKIKKKRTFNKFKQRLLKMYSMCEKELTSLINAKEIKLNQNFQHSPHSTFRMHTDHVFVCIVDYGHLQIRPSYLLNHMSLRVLHLIICQK